MSGPAQQWDHLSNVRAPNIDPDPEFESALPDSPVQDEPEAPDNAQEDEMSKAVEPDTVFENPARVIRSPGDFKKKLIPRTEQKSSASKVVYLPPNAEPPDLAVMNIHVKQWKGADEWKVP